MKIPCSFFLLLISLCSQAQDRKTGSDNNPLVKSEPLYSNALVILDGKKIDQGSDANAKNKYLDINAMVNPMDIESIDILKGETAMKSYGEEGRNGVILITTKNNSQPLYVVDGEKIPPRNTHLYSTMPKDEIASIEVLKGEHAIKSYGESGKNGVILITTKKASKSIQR